MRLSVAYSGPCCADLDNQYKALLATLKKCCVPCASPFACSVVVGTELACPCPTYVNPPTLPDSTALSTLKNQWFTEGCASGVICPPGCLLQPIGGACTPSTSGDLCVDLF